LLKSENKKAKSIKLMFLNKSMLAELQMLKYYLIEMS